MIRLNEEALLHTLYQATVEAQGDAWEQLFLLLSPLMRAWLRQHRLYAVLLARETEQNCIASAFMRFWQATTHRTQFHTTNHALAYLKRTLYTTLIDTLRTRAETPLPEEYENWAMPQEYPSNWYALHSVLPQRHQKLAWLLFYCNLHPRDIIMLYPHEWTEREIRLGKQAITRYLMRHKEQLRYVLSH